MKWSKLKFWKSGEWQVIQERLHDMSRRKILYNPERKNLFAAMEAVKLDDVRVVIMGQDPYPNRAIATGIAFSIPKGYKPFPPTLVNIFKEYSDDLHLPTPDDGDLTPWCEQGVLLWNSVPTCRDGLPASHREWDEWSYLTKEIIEILDQRPSMIFCLLGRFARDFAKYINNSEVIETSHPSPLGAHYGFFGSRIFTSINSKLVEYGETPINWRL